MDRHKVHQALLKLREARRDLAFAVHGDEWRKHCPPAFWSHKPQDELEQQFLNEQLRHFVADSNI